MTVTDPVTRYEPRGGCLAAHLCRDDEVLLAGPAGTGKTHAWLMKLHLIMRDNDGARGLMCRKTGVSLASSTLETWRSHVVADELLDGSITYYGGSREEPAQDHLDLRFQCFIQ